MIIPTRRLLPFIPPSISAATVEACRVTVHYNIHLGLHRYRVTLPDGQERTGGCSSEPLAVRRAAWELADMYWAWSVAS